MGRELRSTPRVIVVGGANTDVVGTPVVKLLARDSNPGHIRVSAGGVGRNIAENLARLDVGVSLITAFGGDSSGATLREGCEAAGIDTSLSTVVPDLPGAHYLAILDERHDMAVAVNDMRVLDCLTPDVLAEPTRANAVAEAGLIVVDANLPAESIEWLARQATCPVMFEPVSVAKGGRARGVLSRLAAITPNAAEAAELLGHAVDGIDGAQAAARELVGIGIGSVFVTCGEDGIAWADPSGSGVLAAPRVPVVNASGAGDAFCAGVAWALLGGHSGRVAAEAGSILAALTLEDRDTVSARVTRDALEAAMDSGRTT